MYRKALKISLVLVYLVIIAGAVVRMTGSGMGCPDWPKCFGYWIPPTEVTTLEWQADKSFQKGQVIIVDESLQVAKVDVQTASAYNAANWESYDKHDYAVFDVWHTWIEYVNRLFGALGGLAVLWMAILSIKWWKRRKRITIISWLSVFLMGFQGWLGATVVYSVLAPVRITIHMVVALVIVAVLIYLLYASAKANDSKQSSKSYDALFKNGMLLAMALTLLQIILGTQVRQYVDDQVGVLGYTAKDAWLENPTLSFYIHRTFSVAVLVLNLWLFFRNKKLGLGHARLKWVLVFIALEAISGIAMYYADFPFGSQPLHLVVASLLFAVQFYILLESFPKRQLEQSAI